MLESTLELLAKQTRGQHLGMFTPLAAHLLATEMARLYWAAGESIPPALRPFLPQPSLLEDEK